MSTGSNQRPGGRSSTGSTVLALGVALVAAGLWFRFGRERPDEREPGAAVRAAERPSAPGGGGASRTRTRKDEDPSRPRPRLEASRETIELGRIAQCGGVARTSVTLRNPGDQAVKVAGWSVSCACVRVQGQLGLVIEPGGTEDLELEVDPWGIGAKSARVDFRLEGNAIGPRVRLDYTVAGPIRARPSVAIRPDRGEFLMVELERCDDEGAHVDEPFEVMAVLPPVGEVYRVAADEPPLDAGWGGFTIDFALIDELAAAPEAASDPAFDWKDTPSGRRWKSIEIRVTTDHPQCGELRLRALNR